MASYSTDTEPDGTLLKCCGNRREAVCPSCARTYRGDAFQLVASGMRGGKGVPETIAEHPLVFLTLTAPSFGPVHSRRVVDGQARRCRPRRKGEVCPHGVSLACNVVHDEDDPCLGEPICAQCFDYEHAVLWNALAPELWRRTAIQLPRELARLCGVSQKRLRVRVSYVKVAEFQRRGALHFHCVLRLDGVTEDGELEAPAARYGSQLLIDAATAAARHVTVVSPTPEDRVGRLPGIAPGAAREIRWGAQVEVRELDTGGAGKEAASCAAYIAKYATKATEAVGGLMYRLEAGDLERLKVRPHVRRFVECAWRLGGYRHLQPLRLRHWAHALGFRGHCFTKSRRYSTTFTRAAPGAARAPAQARRRAARAADRALAVERHRLPDDGRRVPRRVRPQARASSSGASHARSFAPPRCVRPMKGDRGDPVTRAGRAVHHGQGGRRAGRALAGDDPALLPRGPHPGPAAARADPPGAVPVERGRGGLGLRAAARARRRGMRTKAPAEEQIRALATVTLDAKALDELGPQTMDRLADLVAAKLAERHAAGAGAAADGRPRPRRSPACRVGTVRRAIQLGRWRSSATSVSGRGCAVRTSTPGSHPGVGREGPQLRATTSVPSRRRPAQGTGVLAGALRALDGDEAA